VGGQQLEFFFYPGSIFMTPFTLPTNGADFRALVNINFSISGFNFDTGQTIFLEGGSSGAISFSFSPPTGLYYAGSFVEAPEPGTLELLGSGLIGIAALVRKRLRRN
jgi:PEP-CTERM motif